MLPLSKVFLLTRFFVRLPLFSAVSGFFIAAWREAATACCVGVSDAGASVRWLHDLGRLVYIYSRHHDRFG